MHVMRNASLPWSKLYTPHCIHFSKLQPFSWSASFSTNIVAAVTRDCMTPSDSTGTFWSSVMVEKYFYTWLRHKYSTGSVIQDFVWKWVIVRRFVSFIIIVCITVCITGPVEYRFDDEWVERYISRRATYLPVEKINITSQHFFYTYYIMVCYLYWKMTIESIV